MFSDGTLKPRWSKGRIIPLLIVAILVAGILAGIRFANRSPKIVHSSSSGTYTNQNGTIGSDGFELFPSPDGAASKFDVDLANAEAYQEFSPCFDDRGQRVGNKAAMWMHSPPPTKAFWRIVWTERRSNSSQLYWVEADTLDGAHNLENQARQKWRLCRTTK